MFMVNTWPVPVMRCACWSERMNGAYGVHGSAAAALAWRPRASQYWGTSHGAVWTSELDVGDEPWPSQMGNHERCLECLGPERGVAVPQGCACGTSQSVVSERSRPNRREPAPVPLPGRRWNELRRTGRRVQRCCGPRRRTEPPSALPAGGSAWAAYAQTPFGLGDLYALPSAQPNEVSLSDHSQDVEQQPPDRVGGVVYRPTQVQTDLTLGELVSDGSSIGQRPRKPVEFRDHQRVTFAASGQGFAQTWSFPIRPRESLVNVDPVSSHTEWGDAISLSGQVLLIGGGRTSTTSPLPTDPWKKQVDGSPPDRGWTSHSRIRPACGSVRGDQLPADCCAQHSRTVRRHRLVDFGAAGWSEGDSAVGGAQPGRAVPTGRGVAQRAPARPGSLTATWFRTSPVL